MVTLFMLEYMTVLGITMMLLFLDNRYSRRLSILVSYGTALVLMAAIAAIYCTAGAEVAMHSYSLVVHVPVLLLFMVLNRFRGWRLVFQLLSSILFCALIQHCAGLVYYLLGGSIWVLFVSYGIFTAAILLFLMRFLRPLYVRTLLTLKHGWWLICLVIAIYYFIEIYLIPGIAGLSQSSTILKPAISLLMVGFYTIMIFLFASTQKETEARHSAQLSALQLSALQSRMETVKAAEQMIRIERHDLRHRLQAAAELVARGDQKAALDFLDAAQQRLDNQKEIRWCRPPVLDAMFAAYFNQAQQAGIAIHASFAFPDPLPVEESELAIVFANALDNAIHANMALPHAQREIRCKVVSAPSLMIELSNPCDSTVTFDEQGLPVARREGHGLGVHSISDFCRKHGAVCQFALTDGWFQLRLVL